MLKKVYVWELPVRLTHWLAAISIVVLSFTGFYISKPFLVPPPTGDLHLMSIMRFIHFVAAYVFMVSFLIRIYWAFVGNQYARWGEFVPLTKHAWKAIFDDIRFYLFLKKDHPHRTGHHALAAFTYLGLFFFFHFEIVTGFAIYSESHHGFVSTLMGGWILPYISAQTLRLYHHLVMWLMIAFAVFHVYAGWYIDSIEKNSMISSIFSGYKTVDEK